MFAPSQHADCKASSNSWLPELQLLCRFQSEPLLTLAPRPTWKSVSLTRIRYRMLASLRATATIAHSLLDRLAIRSPRAQGRSFPRPRQKACSGLAKRLPNGNVALLAELLHRLVRDIVGGIEHCYGEIERLRSIIKQLQPAQFGRPPPSASIPISWRLKISMHLAAVTRVRVIQPCEHDRAQPFAASSVG
jgi:hypothetical protein